MMCRTPRSRYALLLILCLTLVFGWEKKPEAHVMNANDVLDYGSYVYSDSGVYAIGWYYAPSCCTYPYSASNVLSTYQGIYRTSWNTSEDGIWSYGLGRHQIQYGHATGTTHAVMQSDGNFVLYDSAYTYSLWQTTTNGNSGAFLNVQDDHNVVVYTSSNVAIWSIY